VSFILESPNFKNARGHVDNEDNRLKLSLCSPSSPDASGKFWVDADKRKLEGQIREFMIAVLIKAEQRHRDQAFHHREWLIERKEDVIKEIARRKAEQERREKEQRAREEKAKVDALLRQAEDIQKAMTIRAYVQEIRRRLPAPSGSSEAFENWSKWTLEVADQLDPAMNPELLANCICEVRSSFSGGIEGCPSGAYIAAKSALRPRSAPFAISRIARPGAAWANCSVFEPDTTVVISFIKTLARSTAWL